MSIYNVAQSGTKVYRSRFNLSHRKIFDATYGTLIPAMAKFVLPGDIWKIGANIFARYQPTLAPILTRANIRMRYFFVPLRLVEANTEKVITGSENGKLIETALPTFEDIFTYCTPLNNHPNVEKYSFLDYLGIPVGTNVVSNRGLASAPAAYWLKAYLRIWFDFYRDENLFSISDFDTFVTSYKQSANFGDGLLHVMLRKDYFTSALPWQLKGSAPTFTIGPWALDFTNAVSSTSFTNDPDKVAVMCVDTEYDKIHKYVNPAGLPVNTADSDIIATLNKATVSAQSSSFNMADLRAMSAQTRLFERLARCGSRYVEFLHANFNIAPADETLQRAQYLGGFKQPIVTTEIAQTAEDSTNPVGTLRGKGISNSGNSIKTFHAKEFGVIFGLMDIMPDIQYTQGIDRELTYKTRFDFFNPSFQNLSEQEIRNGEVYFGNDNKNDETFGFTEMYNELRSSKDIVVGDMRDSLKYWTQSISYASRPNLNINFINSASYETNFLQPFTVISGAKPIIVDCANLLDVYRPMTRYSTPGLVDHN